MNEADHHIPYENLGKYIANEVDDDERASIDQHLKDCPACRQDLSDAQFWQTHLATLPPVAPPPSTFNRLLIAFIAALATILATFLYWRFR